MLNRTLGIFVEEARNVFTLENLFDGSAHKSTIFSHAQIDFVESNAYTKIVRGKSTPFIKCLVRGKEIRLTPEEAVRQMFIRKLIDEYGYKPAQMAVEHPIHFGREVKRADIVIFEKSRPTVEYIIVEVKKPKLKDGKDQLKSYCNATGATMGVWSNGEKISFYQRKDPNYFEDIPDIPHANQKLKDILRERRTIANLIDDDKLLREGKTLSELILEMEDEVLANAGVDVFEEVFKLIYTKLYDEMLGGRDTSRVLEFWNYGETDADLKDTIQNLFDRAKDKWPGIFADDDKIRLTASHLAICVSSLQGVKLFNSNLDVIDDAFEYLVSKSQKGEKGQYFTPRYVIDMCVKMLNPSVGENMIDTAAGSCGFPVHTTFYVWDKILAAKGLPKSHLFSAEPKPPECEDYVNKNVFAIDFDEKTVRVARTLNLIAGDGKTNVLHLNTLDYERWNEVIRDEDWREVYNTGWQKFIKLRAVKNDNSRFNFDIVMANPPFAGDIKESRIITRYELGKNAKGKYQSKVGRDILFIERNLNFLKPGGRMAIVLPQGRFNNSSDKYIRDFIAARCRILAVVGLHGNVFKPHTGTKTSVLFVQKWDDELCPQREDYPIFFATMREPSKDNSGEKIFEVDADGLFLRDDNHHTIVRHDLFNHDGKTRDGIAEAFIEFAKREGLSFFDRSSFDAVKYRRLSEELECTEKFLSELACILDYRIEAEYFLKKFLRLDDILSKNACASFAECFNFLNGRPYISEEFDTNEIISADENFDVKVAKIGDVTHKRTVDNWAGISRREFKNQNGLSLIHGDILMTLTGDPPDVGKVCFINNPPENCTWNQRVARIQIKDHSQIFSAEYAYALLSSNFCRLQIERLAKGIRQRNLGNEGLRRVLIPLLSKTFLARITDIVCAAFDCKERADNHYRAAEKILSEVLGLDSFTPSKENVAVKSLSASFGVSDRLDAEFYQPKYDDLKIFLDTLTTCKLGDLVKIFKSIEPGSDFYGTKGTPFIRVSDVNKFGISEPEIKLVGNYDERLFPRKDTILFSKDGSIGIAYKVREDMTAITSGALLHLTVKDNAHVLPDYLTLVLNSSVVQMQAERDSNGAIIQHWKPDDIRKVIVPVVAGDLQEKIAAQVAESFRLRGESEKLLSRAKQAVELAIEHDENFALKFLNA